MRLVLAFALVSTLASAQELPKNLAHELGQPHASAPSNPTGELYNPPANETEAAIMTDLACVCGTCNREPIRTCRCDLAAKMRGEVKAQLAGVHTATATARKAAHDKVLASFARTYGADVLKPMRIASIDNRLGSIPIVVMLAVGLALIVWRARGASRRARERERLPRNDDVVI